MTETDQTSAAPILRSMVAVGDSFTEGMCDDLLPDGQYRGWADRVAQRLAGEQPGFRYANLAVRGKLIGQIVDEQLDLAVAMDAELVTLAGGLNDVMRPGCEPDLVVARLSAAAEALAGRSRRLVMFTSTDPRRRMRGSARLLPAIERLREFVLELGQRDGIEVVDLFPETCFDDPRLWAEDRLHLSAEGHRRVAEAVLEALGRTPSFDWREPLPPAAPPTLLTRLRADARWLRLHAVPWVIRRLTGRSSGDGRPAKRPDLTAYEF
jgi:lysophospholipase L1-like esterase